jgi:hypothetical protein
VLGFGKVAGVVLLGGALAGGAWWWNSARRSASVPAPSTHAAVRSAGPASAPRPPEVPAATPPSAASEPVASASAEPSQHAQDTHTVATASEAQLLQRARAALSTDPALALRLTQTHKQRFGNGQLAQEREVIAIDALERLNRGAEAKQRAGQFHADFPDSVHQRKVDEIAH